MPHGFTVLTGLTSVNLAGTITARIVDNDGADPGTILDPTIDIKVEIEWKITGKLVPLLTGTWQPRVHFDGVGGVVGHTQNGTDIPLIPGQEDYDALVVLPGGTLTGDSYNVKALVTYLDGVGNTARLGGFFTLGGITLIG
ncbi:hypothetical protein SAMN05421505_118115 [Sinosporangium album]|uniref:Uncharacterized protein n=1 Tax=Sinosporangium album TaxID=504805 RepID=A0A1G8DP98_9ACTN|nr:hypothetical protein [Sinosporangium album]SDH59210.1 hypothetical protein SAMN05421505_118115 [Sinosporangium album]